MKLRLPFLVALIVSSISLSAQKVVSLLETEVEIAPKSQVEYVFGFAPEDYFELDVKLSKGRLSEVSVLNLADSVEVTETRVSHYQYKSGVFKHEEVVQFRLINKQFSPKNVKVRILRYPGSEELAGYNSAVEWKTQVDTIWKYIEINDTIAFDTLTFEKSELVLDSLYHYEMELLYDSVIVPARTQQNNNANPFKILPVTYPVFDNTKYEQRRLTAWAFAVVHVPVGIGAIINPPFKPKDSTQLTERHITGDMTELGAFAIDLLQVVKLPLSDRQYRYYLMNAYNAQLFMQSVHSKFILGNTATQGFHRFDNDENQWNEIHYIAIDNNNHNFNVNIHATAVGIVEVKTFRDTTYTAVELKPIIEKRMGDVPVVLKREVPRAIGFGAQLPKAESITVKVAVVIQDPVLTEYENKRLHEVIKTPGYTFTWNDPFELNREYEAALEKLSHGVVQYEVVRIIDDGKFFSRRNDTDEMVSTDEMVELLKEPGWKTLKESGTYFDYQAFVEYYGFDEMRDRDEINEVWVWSFPYGGMWESNFCGATGFWLNSEPTTTTKNKKLLTVMGLNYERNMSLALESYGHRTESVLWHVYQRWDKDAMPPNNWWHYVVNWEEALELEKGRIK